jgi:tetratricopeptide (TPR) repeat protein
VRHKLKSAALVGLGLTLASFAPSLSLTSPDASVSDPSEVAKLICGSRDGSLSLTRNLLMSSAAAAPASQAAAIPLFADLTRSAFRVTTNSPQAQRYFSQGLLLTYGFSHAGAVRSFREAQRIDPGCAMCWWGEAVALGPNINAPMDERDRPAALGAIDRAMAMRDQVSPLERALIEALALRYSRDPKADRAALDAAYADAMIAAAARFPQDDDVAVLAAEAAMDTSPWNYWGSDKRTPIGRSGDAVRLVENVVRRNPAHAQAGHLYIHLLEASDPQRAEATADRLAVPSAPTAGHLVHMPGHIYQRLGRHADSIRVNVAAARADEAFIRGTDDQSLVRYGYYPHNIHFIVTSAQMAGDMRTAIREAQRLRTVLDPETSARIAWIQAIDAAPFLAMAQFAKSTAILAMPAPDPRLPYAAAMRHFARAIAQSRLGDQSGFEAELAAINRLKASNAFAGMIEQGVPAPDLLALAEAVARGKHATAQRRYADAIGYFRKAAAIEARLPYQEPAYWYYPVQQSLGGALFLAGDYGAASQAFRAALVQTPDNGWILYGLARSEAAQGHKLEAAAARRAFDKAWLGDRRWLRMERL